MEASGDIRCRGNQLKRLLRTAAFRFTVRIFARRGVFRSNGTHENSMHARLAFLNCLHCRCFIFNLLQPISTCSRCANERFSASASVSTLVLCIIRSGREWYSAFTVPRRDQKAKLVFASNFPRESASRIKSRLKPSRRNGNWNGVYRDFGWSRGKSRAGGNELANRGGLPVSKSDASSSRDKSTCYAFAVCR